MGPIDRLFENISRELIYVYWMARIALGAEFIPFHGLKVPVRSCAPVGRVKKSLLLGHYERPEIELLRKAIRPDDVVVELGAGIGVVSAIIGKCLGPNGRLCSFEANPALIASIEAVAAVNGLSHEIRNEVVGISDGEIEFFFDETFVSSSKIKRTSQATPTLVRQTSIGGIYDDLCPTVLVMDIEGAEKEILSVPLPKSVRAVYAEFHPHVLGDAIITNMLSNIFAQGFSLVLDETRGRVVSLERNVIR